MSELRHCWRYVEKGVRECLECGDKQHYVPVDGRTGPWAWETVTESKFPDVCAGFECLPEKIEELDEWRGRNCSACDRYTNKRGTTRYVECELALAIFQTPLESRSIPLWAAWRIGLRYNRAFRARCKEFKARREAVAEAPGGG